jgi:cold shock CspA family protein
MGAGRLKMWNAERGFGFIAGDGGGADVFLRISELTAGLGFLFFGGALNGFS